MDVILNLLTHIHISSDVNRSGRRYDDDDDSGHSGNEEEGNGSYDDDDDVYEEEEEVTDGDGDSDVMISRRRWGSKEGKKR